MSMHPLKVTEVKDPGPWQVPAKAVNTAIALIVIGLGLFGAGFAMDATRGWSAYLVNFLFVFFLSLSGLLFVAVQYLTSAVWSPAVRRIPEGMTAFLPLGILFLALFWFGVPKLYSWSGAAWVSAEGLTREIARSKTTWLSQPFFTARHVVFAVIWLMFGLAIVKNSRKQDSSKDPALTHKNAVLSILFTIIFAISFSILSYDLLMSLEPNWFSTMFGVYTFIGLFQSGIAAITLFAIAMKKSGALPLTREGHIRDLGTFLFAMSVFFSYIGFCQFMLIWYANLPEETFYYLKRIHEGWWIIFLILPLLKFILPFVMLMSAKSKMNEKLLVVLAVGILIGQWFDMYWMVYPANYKVMTMPGLADIGGLFFFGGLFLFMVFRAFKSHSVLPVGDPKILTSLNWGA